MRRFLAIFLVVSFLGFGGLSASNYSDPVININFKNLKIVNFVKMVAKITHKNILVDKQIKGNIDFIAVKPIRRSQIFNLLVNILDTKGYSIRDTKMGFLKIIKNADAPRTAPPLVSDDNIAEVQTAIIPVKNINARNILRQVNFLLSRYGKIAISYESNSVIVTDYPANIRSIRGVLNSLDKQRDTTVKFVKLREASAKNVYPKIKKIAGALFDKNVKTQKVDVTYDDATNSIILVGNRDNIYKLMPKIRKLDTIDNTIDKRMEIIHLKNANCEDLVKILQKLLSDKSFGKTSQSGGVKSRKKTKRDSVLPSVSGKDKPTVTVDPELNAIVVFATGSEIAQIKELIRELDIERQQVYVVAKIFEISRGKAAHFGAKYGFSGGAIGSSGVLGLSGNLGGSFNPLVSLKTFLYGTENKGFANDINLKKAFGLSVALDLYKENSIANVVSEPTLLCINNKESSLYAGKTVSVLDKSQKDASSGAGITNSYSREDIGLTLKVKPRISSDDKVVLDIKTVLEDVIGGTVGLPTTTKREVKTTSIVKDGETVIIGGLVKNKDGKNNVKVPLLGDIPVLGSLFTHKDNSKDKTDLVIMITPYIVKTSDDLQIIRDNLGKLETFSAQYARELDAKLKSGEQIVETHTVIEPLEEGEVKVYDPTPATMSDSEDF